jgi:hypothetical protein
MGEVVPPAAAQPVDVGGASGRWSMAHLFGMLAGLPLGMLAGAFRLREITSGLVQAIAGVIALLLPVLAWSFAVGVR